MVALCVLISSFLWRHSLRTFSDDVLCEVHLSFNYSTVSYHPFFIHDTAIVLYSNLFHLLKNAIPKILKKTKFWIFTIFSTNHNVLMKKEPKIIYSIVANAWICDKSAFRFSWENVMSNSGILLPKLFWPTVRKNCSSDWENLFEITRTIYSNSERSEQFLVTECFFNLFLISNKLEQL